MSLTNVSQQGGTIYLWNRVALSGSWAVGDLQGHSGDYFTVDLPEGTEGVNGSFTLDGQGDHAGKTFGTCTVTSQQMRCELNENVEGKNNVGGTFTLNFGVTSISEISSFTFTVNGSIPVEVPLPGGQQGIGYDPHVPTEIEKYGYVDGNPYDSLSWRIRVPGGKLSGSTLRIVDDFAMAGASFTVKKDSVRLLALEASPRCMSVDSLPGCKTVLDNAVFNIDDDNDRIEMTYENGTPFSDEVIYLMQFTVEAGEDILVGAEYHNSATVNGQAVSAVATRAASGSGTGSGDTVGHIRLTKALTDVGGSIPADVVYLVTYSYTYKGHAKTGTINLKAGVEVPLNNLPHGVTVTLTEGLPSVEGAVFQDPVFSGAGVTDGQPDQLSAQVVVEGTKTIAVTLTNTTATVVNPVTPKTSIGQCPIGATDPTQPTIGTEETPGIAYSDAKAETVGDKVVFSVTATAQPGYQLAANLGDGWTRVTDTIATYRVEETAVRCAAVVAPVDPSMSVGVCPADSLTPSEPVITAPVAPEGIEYSDVAYVVDGQKVTFTATATTAEGFQLPAALEGNWTRVSATEARFSVTQDAPACEAITVVPVTPNAGASSCPVGAYEPSAPTVDLATTDGLVYAVTKQPTLDGTNFVYEVTATPINAKHAIGADQLPDRWTLAPDGVATFTGSVPAAPCAAVVAPVDPSMSVGVCPADSLTPSEPVITAPVAPEGIEYSDVAYVVDGQKVTFTATATTAEGFQLPAALEGNWTRVSATEARFSVTQDAPACLPTEVSVITPKITPSLCQPGATTPTTPAVEVPSVSGLIYGKPTIAVEDKQVTITITATPDAVSVLKQGELPSGWTGNDDGSATFTYRAAEPDCVLKAKPGLPKTGR